LGQKNPTREHVMQLNVLKLMQLIRKVKQSVMRRIYLM